MEIKIQFSRHLSNILLVTYLPTILMNIINHATNYFIGEEFFGDAIAVNVTCMMVLASIYIAVSESLPLTSSIKYVDIWLLFSLIYPFLVVLLATYIHVERRRSTICSPVLKNKIEMKQQNRRLKKLRVAEFVANYVLPLIFVTFTIMYFSICLFITKY